MELVVYLWSLQPILWGRHQNQIQVEPQTSFCFPGLSLITRSCTSPTPSCGGTACPGSSSQETTCNIDCCGNQRSFGHFLQTFQWRTVVGVPGLTMEPAANLVEEASKPDQGHASLCLHRVIILLNVIVLVLMYHGILVYISYDYKNNYKNDSYYIF